MSSPQITEHEHALSVAEKIRDFAKDQGIPAEAFVVQGAEKPEADYLKLILLAGEYIASEMSIQKKGCQKPEALAMLDYKDGKGGRVLAPVNFNGNLWLLGEHLLQSRKIVFDWEKQNSAPAASELTP